MDTIDPLRFILSLAFVIGLIGTLAWLAKRCGLTQLTMPKQTGGRVQVLEVRYIDPKRKLVLVRRDEVEHLLLCAEGATTVVEAGIKKDK